MDPTPSFAPELVLSPRPNPPYVALGIARHGVAPLSRCPKATAAKPHMVKFHMRVVRSCNQCGVQDNLNLRNTHHPYPTNFPIENGMIPVGFISSNSQCFVCQQFISADVMAMVATSGLCQQCSIIVRNFLKILSYPQKNFYVKPRIWVVNSTFSPI